VGEFSETSARFALGDIAHLHGSFSASRQRNLRNAACTASIGDRSTLDSSLPLSFPVSGGFRPWQPELALGALVEGGVRLLDAALVQESFTRTFGDFARAQRIADAWTPAIASRAGPRPDGNLIRTATRGVKPGGIATFLGKKLRANCQGNR
jgi:hypothetical protein